MAQIVPAEVAAQDPAFSQLIEHFCTEDVAKASALEPRKRYLAVLAALLGRSSVGEFKHLVPVALEAGATPQEVKELIYQASSYIGLGCALMFIKATNQAFEELGLAQEAEKPGEVESFEARVARGSALQVEVFGDYMANFATSGDAFTKQVNAWISANCFGDLLSRPGLTVAERELYTVCILAGLGGCDAQLGSHIAGNVRLGTTVETLVDAISQTAPFIGYPRALNALRVLRSTVHE
jgi:4-carboxymuconolactone decarboxylase